jgi:hypothetical protein
MTSDKRVKLYPKFEYKPFSMFGEIQSVEHPFLQEIINMKAGLCFLGKEFTVYACDLVGVLLFIYEDSIEIECISTVSEKRRTGQASEVMRALTHISDKTGIPITLRTANVTGNGYMMMQHPVIMLGMKKTNKVPTAKLKTFYEKFGFKVTEKVKSGYRMIYQPAVTAQSKNS